MRRNLAIALLLVIAALLAGCGELDSIKITHDARSMLELGETVNLQAKGVSSMGFGVKLEDAEWSVSDEKVAAIVGNGTEAVLTALLPGEVVVTATSGDLSGTLAFTVVGELPNPLMFAESFEDGEVGAYPEGGSFLIKRLMTAKAIPVLGFPQTEHPMGRSRSNSPACPTLMARPSWCLSNLCCTTASLLISGRIPMSPRTPTWSSTLRKAV